MSAIGRIKPKVWSGHGHPPAVDECHLDGDTYIDTSTEELWLHQGGRWFGPYPTTAYLKSQQLQGPEGPPGHDGAPGPTGPSGASGPTGPCCTGPAQTVLPTGPIEHVSHMLNKCTGDTYSWDGHSWVLSGSLLKGSCTGGKPPMPTDTPIPHGYRALNRVTHEIFMWDATIQDWIPATPPHAGASKVKLDPPRHPAPIHHSPTGGSGIVDRTPHV